MPGRRELRETERTIATLGAGVSVCDGAGSVAPQARLAGTLFAPYSFVTGQEGLEQGAHVVLLGLVQEHRGLEEQPQGLVGGEAFVVAEHQRVGAHREGDGQAPQCPQRGLGGAGLVAAQLGDVHLGPLGQGDLGEPGLAAKQSQAFPELHLRDRSRPLQLHMISDTIDSIMQKSYLQGSPATGSFVAKDLAPGASDQDVLGAVVEHYVRSLAGRDKARGALAGLGVDEETARAFRVGYSDRSLGPALPGRQWKQGAELRSQLTRLGVFRPSGHEHFVGCLVVPVSNTKGEVVGLCGRRLDRGSVDLWAEGLPGGWFNATEPLPTEVVMAADIFEALAVIGAGHPDVLALARPGGLSRDDAKQLASRGVRHVVLLGPATEQANERLGRAGIVVGKAGMHLPIAEVLRGATDRAGALAAVLAEADVAVAQAPRPGPVTAGSVRPDEAAPTVSGDASELYVSFGDRRWRARGGARSPVPGSLRVALSVTDERSGRFHLDTLDLYAARARSAYLAGAVAELRTGVEALRKELAEVIFAVERAQAGEGDEVPGPSEMTEGERAAAMGLLASPDLLARIGADLASLGVVGEETNLVVAYLATISRKAERPFGVVVQSSSAAGKSTLADAVAAFVPEEDLVSLSALTAQAVYYLGAGDLARKVLFVSEEHGASRAAYALKLLISEGRLAIAWAGKDPDTGRLRTRSYGVEGPLSLLMTTTAAEVDPELANRLVVLGVDEDRAQTRAVQAAQRRAATLEGLVARLRRDDVVRLHRNAQRLLDPLPVVVPGAEELAFPDSSTRHRRDHQKLLSVIASIALLHQHQRPQGTLDVAGTTVRYVEASADDVALGVQLCQEVLVRAADELSPPARRLLSVMQSRTSQHAGTAPVRFTRRELRELTGWSEHQVRVGLGRLVTLEYVAEQRDRPGRRHTYLLADDDSAGPRDGPREVREPPSRVALVTSPGRTGNPATVGRISNGPVSHVAKGDVHQGDLVEAQR